MGLRPFGPGGDEGRSEDERLKRLEEMCANGMKTMLAQQEQIALLRAALEQAQGQASVSDSSSDDDDTPSIPTVSVFSATIQSHLIKFKFIQ